MRPWQCGLQGSKYPHGTYRIIPSVHLCRQFRLDGSRTAVGTAAAAAAETATTAGAGAGAASAAAEPATRRSARKLLHAPVAVSEAEGGNDAAGGREEDEESDDSHGDAGDEDDELEWGDMDNLEEEEAESDEEYVL